MSVPHENIGAVLKQCRNCGNEFESPTNGIGRARVHCSRQCQRQYVRGRQRSQSNEWPRCSIDDCANTVRSSRAQHCAKHYHRIYRNGTLDLTSPQRPQRGICTIEGCQKVDVGPIGLCLMHSTRARRNGDPLVLRGPHVMLGEDNPNWLGENIQYGAAHDRVRVRRGSATQHSCTDCNRPAAHWSYNHTDPNELHRDSDGVPYSPDPEHYSARCVPCHKKFDLSRKASRAPC